MDKAICHAACLPVAYRLVPARAFDVRYGLCLPLTAVAQALNAVDIFDADEHPVAGRVIRKASSVPTRRDRSAHHVVSLAVRHRRPTVVERYRGVATMLVFLNRFDSEHRPTSWPLGPIVVVDDRDTQNSTPAGVSADRTGRLRMSCYPGPKVSG